MKILHILKTEADDKVNKIIEIQKGNNEVHIVELNKDNLTYEELIDLIFKCDKVISW